ncbi:MAG: GPI anchored serine-threonine rich family protein [Candidatus Portnoybacteria bacterium]|nr:GPI anchored serine-threonine rich family protein [Candidatus Portnoybacteria bacterium]
MIQEQKISNGVNQLKKQSGFATVIIILIAAVLIIGGGVYLYQKSGFKPTSTQTKSNSPYITLLSPNGGEVWEIGKTYEIKWELRNINTTVKEISIVAINEPVIGEVASNDVVKIASVTGQDVLKGIYKWQIPNNIKPSDRYSIEISIADQDFWKKIWAEVPDTVSFSDFSDGFIGIVNKSVQNWKTYQNEECGFEVKYPANCSIEEITGESAFCPGDTKGIERLKYFEIKDCNTFVDIYNNSNNLGFGEWDDIYHTLTCTGSGFFSERMSFSLNGVLAIKGLFGCCAQGQKAVAISKDKKVYIIYSRDSLDFADDSPDKKEREDWLKNDITKGTDIFSQILSTFKFIEIDEEAEQEKAIGYIKKVYEKGGKRYLDIDYVQWLEGEEAIKAAAEDTDCLPEKISICAPSIDYGFYIRNENPKVRTFAIAKNADIRIAIDGVFVHEERSQDGFIGNESVSHLKNTFYAIGIENNEIMKITEKRGRKISGSQIKDVDLAKQTLVHFFNLLNKDDYNGAEKLYNGLKENGRIIVYVLGLTVRKFIKEESDFPNQIDFIIQFSDKDGSLYKFGPCCGATEETMPTRTEFTYRVEKMGAKFFVITPPLYRP